MAAHRTFGTGKVLRLGYFLVINPTMKGITENAYGIMAFNKQIHPKLLPD